MRALSGAAILLLLLAAAACSKAPEQQAKKFLAAGKTFAAKKEYARAILELQNAIRLTPNDAEPVYQLALAYLDSGDYQAGAATLLQATRLNPTHQGAQLKLAELMSGSSSATPELLGQAEERARTVLALSPDNPDALSSLALAEFRSGKVEDATKHLESALEKFPDSLKAAKTMALVRIAGGDLLGAEEILRKAVAQSPAAVEPLFALGRYYVLAKRPAEAEVTFRRAAEIDPKNGPVLLDLGWAQRALGEEDEAEKTFRQLSSLPNKEYRSVHAEYLFDRGQRDEAIKEFEQLAKVDPKDPQAAVRLIRSYIFLKRFPEAERAMDAILKKNPKQTAVLVERARLRLTTGQIQEAMQDLTQALQFEPGLAEAHFLMSKAHQFRGEEAARRQELTEAIKNAPAYLTARLELAQALIAAKGATTALVYLDEAPTAQKRSPALIAQRNWALLAIGDQAALRKSIDEGLAVQKTPELLLQDGYWRIQNKDFRGARESLRKALELNPEETRALDAWGRSYMLENKPALALAAVQDYVSKHPSSAALQHLLGEWLMQSKKLAEARAAFSAALQAAPGMPGPEQRLADLDFTEGNLDSARKRYTAIAASPAGRVFGELRLGLIEERVGGDPQVAITHYRKVLEMEPNNLTALNNLAYHLANDTQQFDEALKVAQQVKELAPNDPNVDDTIGWAYYNKGLFDTAVKYFEAAVAKQPNARRQYHLAMGYFKVGNRKRAQAVLADARKLDPTLPESAVAEQLFANSRKVAN